MSGESNIEIDGAMREKLKEELREELRRELLQEEDEQERPEKDYPWIVFALDSTEYGINSKHVLSIEILGAITPLVDAPSYCPGIAPFRGDMIELLDLRSLFGLEDFLSVDSGSQDGRYMMVVIETQGIKRGVIVDQIVSVEYITEFLSGVVGETKGAMNSRYVSKIAKREKLSSPVLIFNADIFNEWF